VSLYDFTQLMLRILTLLFCTWLTSITSAAQYSLETALGKSKQTTGTEIYAKTRSVVDLSAQELRLAYPQEMKLLRFAENQDELPLVLQKLGESIESLFRDFPNTASEEKVRIERLRDNGTVLARSYETYNYVIEVRHGSGDIETEEFRTDSRGRPIHYERFKGASLTSGFAAAAALFLPKRQTFMRMRYVGKQISGPMSYVIAFVQKPDPGTAVASFQLEGTPPMPVFYQGFAWVDPQSYQMVRMRMDLLAAGIGGLAQQTSDISFSEVKFKDVSHPFYLPREVVVTTKLGGVMLRNRHQYSDYRVFTVESSTSKIVIPPIIKK
jgi:hypothetical protein